MDLNNAIEILRQSYNVIQPAIPSVVAALMATVLIKKNTRQQELEKLKHGKFQEVANELLESGQITHLEYYKCRNFLDIAKKADEYYRNEQDSRDNEYGYAEEFDFDWFLRFFDAAGNISNEKMKDYYAKILSGEISRPGEFSLRTLDTLYNMSQYEMQLFSELSDIVLDGSFFFSSLGDIGQKLNEKYGYNNDALRLLEECGVLNGLKFENTIELASKEAVGFENQGNLLLLTSKSREKLSLTYVSYSLTKVGKELLSIAMRYTPSDYIFELGKEIKEKYPELQISIHPFKEVDSETLSYDSEIDLLKGFCVDGGG